MPTVPSYDRLALILTGKPCGYLRSASGGDVTAEIVRETIAANYYLKKHLGSPYYEDFVIEVGLHMVNRFYSWISAAWAGNYQPHEGAVVALDVNQKAKSWLAFFKAVITETTIPACDASSKDPGYITLKFAPAYTVVNKAPGKVAVSRENKAWISSDFRLDIEGLNCKKVNKVDSFAVKQTFVASTGDANNQRGEPGKIDFPNLKITMLESSAESWFDWHEDFVIKGNNGDGNERNGILYLLAPDQKTDLARINLHSLGIFKLTPDTSNAGTSPVKRVTAELYCERMQFLAPS